MVICYFSAQYLPTVGGVERYTWNLARRTAAAGHRAIVVTSALPGLPDHEVDKDGIEIFRLPVWPVMKGRFPVLRPGSALRHAAKALWSLPIDFCVIQTRMYPQSVWAALEARKRRIPAIVIDHSTGYMPVGHGLVGLCGRWYEHLACGLIRATHPAFYGVSSAVTRWLTTFGIRAAGCLPNAVDPAALQDLAQNSPKDWRSACGLGPGTRLVAYVGRLIPEKGAAELARAVAGLPDTALIIAGDGPLLESLRKTAPDHVFCPGSVPYPETIQLLAQADIYCLPTRYAEGFPTTLLEAAACRCPIVCTPTAGTEELLPGPEYGILLPDAGPEAIRTGLRQMLENPAYARSCADRTYRNLCAHFTWDAVFDKIIEIAKSTG